MLKDSSEIQEAASILADLLKRRHTKTPSAALVNSVAARQDTTSPEPSFEASSASPTAKAEEAVPEMKFRGDRLEHAIATMCRRGGFSSAVVADDKGLPLATHNIPVAVDALSAFTMVLGEAMARAGQIIGRSGADNIYMDISYADKVVLRRFSIDNRAYFLTVICPQGVDERSEVEVSIEQLTSIMTSS